MLLGNVVIVYSSKHQIQAVSSSQAISPSQAISLSRAVSPSQSISSSQAFSPSFYTSSQPIRTYRQVGTYSGLFSKTYQVQQIQYTLPLEIALIKLYSFVSIFQQGYRQTLFLSSCRPYSKLLSNYVPLALGLTVYNI